MLSGCVDSDTPANEMPASTPAGDDDVTPAPMPTPEPTPESVIEPDEDLNLTDTDLGVDLVPLEMGEYAQMSKMRVTLDSCIIEYSTGIDRYGKATDEISFDYKVENLGDEDAYTNELYFALGDDVGAIYSPNNPALYIEGTSRREFNPEEFKMVQPGEKLTGTVVFEVSTEFFGSESYMVMYDFGEHTGYEDYTTACWYLPGMESFGE